MKGTSYLFAAALLGIFASGLLMGSALEGMMTTPTVISVTDTLRLPPDPGWIDGFRLNCVWVPEPTEEE